MIEGEEIIQCFQTIRDQVVFTTKRVFVANVKGITGKKVCYASYPYSKIVSYSIETAGFMDIDSELLLTMQNGMIVQFDFKSQIDIKGIISNIQKYIL